MFFPAALAKFPLHLGQHLNRPWTPDPPVLHHFHPYDAPESEGGDAGEEDVALVTREEGPGAAGEGGVESGFRGHLLFI